MVEKMSIHMVPFPFSLNGNMNKKCVYPVMVYMVKPGPLMVVPGERWSYDAEAVPDLIQMENIQL